MSDFDYKQLSIALFFFIVAAAGWWAYYVQPNDEWRWKIIECTEGDRSKEAFDRCVKKVGPVRSVL